MQTVFTALTMSDAKPKPSCEGCATSVAELPELKTSDDSGTHVHSLHPPSKQDVAYPISYWICRADHSLARSGITIW